jgi:putative PEP-CTERM system TPR-repeat lipoprotein
MSTEHHHRFRCYAAATIISLASAGAHAAAAWVPVAIMPSEPALSQLDQPTDMTEARTAIAKREFDQAMDVGARMIRKSPNDPAGYNVQGVAHLGKRDIVNARKSFEKANSLKPDDVPSSMSLAELDLQERKFPSARSRYESLLKKNPKLVPAMIGLANIEAAGGNDKETLDWLQKARSANPQDAAAIIAVGRYHLRHNNAAAALTELTEGARIHPKNADMLNALAQAQFSGGKPAEGVATLQQIVTLNPQAPVAVYRLGTAQLLTGDYAQASTSFRKAVQLKPDFAEAILALARLEIREKRYDEALKLSKDLQKVNPKSAAGLALEGDVHMARERPAEAVKAYNRALSLQETGVLAAKVHAAKTKAGNAKEADATLQQWVKAHPDDLVALEYSALKHFENANNKAAIEEYERITSKAPRNWGALNNLALAYQRENDPRALATAEQAYKIRQDPGVMDTLGWILVERGETARGLELIQKAAGQSPENYDIRYHLAVALAKAGDKAKSREELKSLLAGDKNFPNRPAAELLLKQL